MYFGFVSGILLYGAYTLGILIDSFYKTKNVLVALKSVVAVYVQFFGYGLGYLRSIIRLYIQGKDVRSAFPGMFS